VTAVAIGSRVGAYQWETGLLVYFSDISYYPRVLIMTPSAVIPHGSFVHIGMTAITIQGSFIKNKGGMTLFTRQRLVLPF